MAEPNNMLRGAILRWARQQANVSATELADQLGWQRMLIMSREVRGMEEPKFFQAMEALMSMGKSAKRVPRRGRLDGVIALRTEIRDLLATDLTYPEIAERLGCTWAQVREAAVNMGKIRGKGAPGRTRSRRGFVERKKK